jgi:curved DNA-binding protein CbpA
MSQSLEPYYQILELEPGVSLKEINKAYKKLALAWHPDRFPQDDIELVRSAAEKLKEINHARDVLRSFHRHGTLPAPEPTPKSRAYQKPPSRRSTSSASRNATPKSPNSRSSSNNKQTQGKPYVKDLSGADFRGADLHEKDLSGRNLPGANLQGANLSDSFLHKVNLEGADLSKANLFRANLLQANLKNANLRECNLIGADLSGSDLSGADLTGAKVGTGSKILVKLTGVNLTGTILPNGAIHS